MGRLFGRAADGFRRLARLVFRAVNNMKLRDKMTALSVFCVVVPMMITFLVLIGKISAAEMQRRSEEVENEILAAENCLDNMKSYMSTVTYALYSAPELRTFLAGNYGGVSEYLDAYRVNREIMHNSLYGANTYIKKLTVYADNETIVNGGGVYRLSSVKDEGWYDLLRDSGKKTVLYPNFDETKYSYTRLRTVSLITYIDVVSKDSYERLAKLDLNYSHFIDVLLQQNFVDDVYICDDELILFSTKEKSTGTEDFRPVEEIDRRAVRGSAEYEIYGNTWHIYVLKRPDAKAVGLGVLKKNAGLFIILVILNILLPTAAIRIINRSTVQRLEELGEHISVFKGTEYEEISSDEAKDEIGLLVRSYNDMARRMNDLINIEYEGRVKRQDNEIARQKAELLALHSQINPHFLFNALESIRMRSLIKKEEETAEAIERLAVLMRRSTDWCDDMVTLEEEARFAETYLKLQQYRFGDRLGYSIDIARECRGLKVPKLTLVTFVENACVHGVEKVSRPCTVLLSAQIEGDILILYIEDTGAGISEEKQEEILAQMRGGDMSMLLKAHSVGILNACMRLKRCFDSEVSFDIESERNAGTCVTITIPVSKME